MIGRLEKVDNAGKSATAATTYWRVAVYAGADKQPECLLMTNNELHTIRQRAKKNPEDCVLSSPKVPWMGWALIVAALAGIIALVWLT